MAAAVAVAAAVAAQPAPLCFYNAGRQHEEETDLLLQFGEKLRRAHLNLWRKKNPESEAFFPYYKIKKTFLFKKIKVLFSVFKCDCGENKCAKQRPPNHSTNRLCLWAAAACGGGGGGGNQRQRQRRRRQRRRRRRRVTVLQDMRGGEAESATVPEVKK